MALPALTSVAAGADAQAEVMEKTVCVGASMMNNDSRDELGNTVFHTGPYSIYFGSYTSQFIYTASDISIVGADEAEISGISFSYDYNVTYGSKVKEAKMKVYMTNTDDSRVYSQPAGVETQTLVFDGSVPISTGKGKMNITLSEPFTYETSKNLMVTIVKESKESINMTLDWEVFKSSGKQMLYYENGSDSYISEYVPVMGLKYSADINTDVTDVAASALSAPAKAYSGDPFEVTATVVNNGTVEARDYTLEIVSLDGETETVVGTASEVPVLQPGESADVKVNVTLENAGTATLAALVKAEGDALVDNNRSVSTEVEVVSVNLRDATLSGPAELELGESADYVVGVTNKGTSAVSDYSVEIVRFIDTEAGEAYAEETVATATGLPSIEAGETLEINVPVDFELGGTFRIEARVQETGSDDVLSSAPLQVNVTFEKASSLRETTLAEGSENTWGSYPYMTGFGDTDVKCGGTETIYPASLVDFPRNGKIYSVEYKLKSYDYGNVNRRYQVYMANTDRTGFVKGAVESLSGMELVYDGCYEFVKGAAGAPMKFELQRPFEYEAGKNLAILVVTLNNSGAYLPDVSAYNVPVNEAGDNYPSTYSRTYSAAPYTFDGTQVYNMAPVVTLGYELNAIEEQIDMETVSVTAPTGDVKEGAESTFRVTVRNAGTVSVDGFRVELLDVSDESAPVVVGDKAVDEPLGAGAQQLVAVKGSFSVDGVRKVAARVVVDGDVNPANDECASIEVTVLPANGVKVVEAGSGLVAYADGVLHVGVADASSAVVCGADGRIVASVLLDGESDVRMSLASGIYVARVERVAGQTLVAKIIVR